LRILLASSEVIPFSKTGGLADVCGSLPRALQELGHAVSVVTPAYRETRYSGRNIHPTGIEFIVPIAGKTVSGRLLKSTLPGDQVPVYLIQQDQYFDRDGLYRHSGSDHIDNCERFIFFSRAVLETIRLLQLDVDVLHVNDWQTGLVPAYLAIEYANRERYRSIASLMTIHNLSYQGQFWHWDMLLTGLDWKYFNFHQMEFHNKLNLLKTGIVFADSVNTVSPQYAREIQTHEFGCGLDPALSHRRSVLSGIVNGVDYSVWDPQIDQGIAATYGPDNWKDGKSQCKTAMQQEMGLPVRPEAPVIGIVSRLTTQKGVDLWVPVMQRWLERRETQWVVLGDGDPDYHERLADLERRHPDKLGLRIGFDDGLAHRIEAGCDMFLMPSRFEPCGLNQLYSLRYGSPPVVRTVGGLKDTVTDVNEDTLNRHVATGFVFDGYSEEALEQTLDRAVATYREMPGVWERIVRAGMMQDWSWRRSAEEYVGLYRATIGRLRQTRFA